MPKNITLNAVSYATDNGDGSSSIRVYPSLESLLEDEFDGDSESEKWQGAINNESPYDYGYIDQSVAIQMIQNDDGTLTLAKSFSLRDGN